jgi:hypothetical protein
MTVVLHSTLPPAARYTVISLLYSLNYAVQINRTTQPILTAIRTILQANPPKPQTYTQTYLDAYRRNKSKPRI